MNLWRIVRSLLVVAAPVVARKLEQRGKLPPDAARAVEAAAAALGVAKLSGL